MDLVIDANILFAALIKESVTKELILSNGINLFAPEFLFEEFYKYKEEILKKTNRSLEEFNEIFMILTNIITLIPEEEFSLFLEKAKSISPDENDSVYFALALKLNCAIWSNDKKLKNQNRVEVLNTEEIFNLIFNH